MYISMIVDAPAINSCVLTFCVTNLAGFALIYVWLLLVKYSFPFIKEEENLVKFLEVRLNSKQLIISILKLTSN
jgi:hypothetical protein